MLSSFALRRVSCVKIFESVPLDEPTLSAVAIKSLLPVAFLSSVVVPLLSAFESALVLLAFDVLIFALAICVVACLTSGSSVLMVEHASVIFFNSLAI